MGSICHTIFECLGNPRHATLYKKIIKKQDIYSCESVKRLVHAFCRKNGIFEEQFLTKINSMTLEGLNYDFFGMKLGKPTEAISEKKFDISVNEDGKNYRILGFIDKLFLFKRKKMALIRDFKTSKKRFEGQDVDANIQHLIYCLAVKHLYPDFVKRQMEFLFLQFDCNGKGNMTMEHVDDYELEGLEFLLTEIQNTINSFGEKTAKSNLAWHKGYPEAKEGFAGKLVCGSAKFAGELKADGSLKWHCPFKFPFDYYVSYDKDGNFISSSYDKPVKTSGVKVKKMRYTGCPVFNHQPSQNDDDWIL